jgi:hypothetical protein
MNNKNNTIKLVAMATTIAMVFLTTLTTQKVSAIYEDEVPDFIPYSQLTNNNDQQQNYLGYHLINDHVYLWYKNNHNNGFVLDQFLTEKQQKVQDETGVRQ